MKPVEESAYLKYDGPENPELDSPITIAKVHAVVQSFKKNMAPGRDQIMNAMICNLNYKTLSQLADFYNTIWANGEVPREWKEAILMPKAGKTKNLQNLRPMFLTLCIGKLLEKVIKTQLDSYIETHRLLPN